MNGSRVDRDHILARLRERIVAFAASYLSRDAAEDLAQEVLLVLHEKYPQLERVEDLLPLSLADRPLQDPEHAAQGGPPR